MLLHASVAHPPRSPIEIKSVNGNGSMFFNNHEFVYFFFKWTFNEINSAQFEYCL